MIFCITDIYEMLILSEDMTKSLRVMELYFAVATVYETYFSVANLAFTFHSVFIDYQYTIISRIAYNN